jgi:hypothetical protein
MKLYILLLSVVVMAAAGCSDSITGPATHGVSFKINGTPITHEGVRCSGSTTRRQFQPADTSAGYASFTPSGQFSALGDYFWTGSGGSGTLNLDVHDCETFFGEDPFTGINRNRTYCDVQGTFEFSAASESGDLVRVTDGQFLCRTRAR